MNKFRFSRSNAVLLFLLSCITAVWGDERTDPQEPAQFCERTRYLNTTFTLCTFNTERDSIKLFHSDPEGAVYRHFDVLAAALQRQGQNLVFAMNGGMYHANRDPVGLFVEDGVERSRLNRNAGPGNFHLLPNGVFYLEGGRAGVMDTTTYRTAGIQPDFATQSGPMLVIDGALHPRFIEDGTSRKIRNGVGVSKDGRTVTFVLSEERVNFHDFGRLFRDRLNIRNALYLDGTISRLFSRELDRNDPGRAMGPIIAIVEQMPELPDLPDTADLPDLPDLIDTPDLLAPKKPEDMEERQGKIAQ